MTGRAHRSRAGGDDQWARAPQRFREGRNAALYRTEEQTRVSPSVECDAPYIRGTGGADAIVPDDGARSAWRSINDLWEVFALNAFEDVRISRSVDGIAGPQSATFFGADIVKLALPEDDPARRIASFAVRNRGKPALATQRVSRRRRFSGSDYERTIVGSCLPSDDLVISVV